MIEQCNPKTLSMFDFNCETFESIAIACRIKMRPALKDERNHLVFGDGYCFWYAFVILVRKSLASTIPPYIEGLSPPISLLPRSFRGQLRCPEEEEEK